MGGSAIGGDLAAAIAADTCPIPILIYRGYDLPAYADEHTLVIASSYSGNTEETLSAFEVARGRGCPLVALTTGGELARLADAWNVPLVSFDYRSPPRAALGFMFTSLLGILRALGAIGDLDAEWAEALSLLEAEGSALTPAVPQSANRAKQLAAHLVDRIPLVVGAEALEPVARRWKTQFNENSKHWAALDELPELDHNTLSGTHFPAEMAARFRVLFLSSAGLRPRNQLRLDLTRKVLENRHVVCHWLPVPGQTKLAQILTAVQLGDYASCYLAFLNGVDPTTIADITNLKQQMSEA